MRTHEVCVCDQCNDVRDAQEIAVKTCLDNLTFWQSCRDAGVLTTSELMQGAHLALTVLKGSFPDDAEIAALAAQAERLLAGQADEEGVQHV